MNYKMKGILKSIDKRIYFVKTDDGRFNTIDVRSEDDKTGLSPMELMLFAAAGCSAIDVQVILEKKRYRIDELIIEIKGERRDEHPKLWREIKYNYIVRGKNIKPDDVRKAIELSLTKYCSASITLVRAGAELSWSYVVEEKGYDNP